MIALDGTILNELNVLTTELLDYWFQLIPAKSQSVNYIFSYAATFHQTPLALLGKLIKNILCDLILKCTCIKTI